MRRLCFGTVFALATLASPAQAQLTSLTQGFEDITTLAAQGYVTQNNSTTIGSTGWFQGNPNVFDAQSGPANSYIGANFNNTTGTNTISNWLLTPELNLVEEGTFSFYTRTVAGGAFPDRLQVRLSTAGASTNVGTTATSVGDFTTLLLDINPTYQTGNAYPNDWTQFTVTLPEQGAGGSGRLAFRYFVEGGGPSGSRSDFIGLDTFSFITPVPEPGLVLLVGAVGLAGLRRFRRV